MAETTGEYINPNQTRETDREFKVRLVRKLMLKGVINADDIKDQLAVQQPPIIVEKRTVYEYMRDVRRMAKEDMEESEELKQTTEEIAIWLREQYGQIIRNLWIEHDKPAKVFEVRDKQTGEKKVVSEHNGFVKIAALTQIRTTIKEMMEMMQSLGLTHKEPEKSQLLDADGNPLDKTPQKMFELNEMFVAFVKSQWQKPIGILEEPKGDK